MTREYTEAEKAEFRAKDKRIARESVLKPVIDKLTDFDELKERKQEVIEVSEYLVNYVYNGLENGASGNVTAPNDAVDWENIAEENGLAIPNARHIKMLDLITSEYKTKTGKAGINPLTVLTHISEEFGRYPTVQDGVNQVVESLVKSN